MKGREVRDDRKTGVIFKERKKSRKVNEKKKVGDIENNCK